MHQPIRILASLTTIAFLLGLGSAAQAGGATSFSATFVRPGSLAFTFPTGTIGSFSSGGYDTCSGGYDTFLTIPAATVAIDEPAGVGTGGLSLVGGIVTEHAAPEPASAVVLALLSLGHAATVRLRNRRGGQRVA